MFIKIKLVMMWFMLKKTCEKGVTPLCHKLANFPFWNTCKLAGLMLVIQYTLVSTSCYQIFASKSDSSNTVINFKTHIYTNHINGKRSKSTYTINHDEGILLYNPTYPTDYKFYSANSLSGHIFGQWISTNNMFLGKILLWKTK